MDKRYWVTYYLTTRKTTYCSYSEEEWKSIQEALKRGWNTTQARSLSFGINFAQVTHYEAQEK